MNRDNVLRLIDHLKRVPDENFFMGGWAMSYWIDPETNSPLYRILHEKLPDGAGMRVPECGTAACVAGHAVALLGTDEHRVMVTDDPEVAEPLARDLLGLTPEQGNELFYGPWNHPRAAAAALGRALAAHEGAGR